MSSQLTVPFSQLPVYPFRFPERPNFLNCQNVLQQVKGTTSFTIMKAHFTATNTFALIETRGRATDPDSLRIWYQSGQQISWTKERQPFAFSFKFNEGPGRTPEEFIKFLAGGPGENGQVYSVWDGEPESMQRILDATPLPKEIASMVSSLEGRTEKYFYTRQLEE